MPSALPYGNLNKMLAINVTLSPASVGAATTAEQTFNCPGIVPGDLIVDVTKPAHQAGLAAVAGRIPAAGQFTIVFINATAGAIVPTASQIYTIVVVRPDGAPNVGQMS